MSRPQFDVVAVGSAVVDHVHRVSMLPRPDDGVAILDRQTGPGGVDGNVAAAAARLGLHAGIIARVGCDAGGTMVLHDFKERGIDIARLQIGGEDETAYSLIFVDGQGRRIMMTGGHGVRRLTWDPDDDAYVRRAKVCFSSAYLPWPHLQRLAKLCTGRGGPAFAFDLPGPFEDLEARGFAREHLDALLPRIDLFFANKKSLRSYTGEETIAGGLRRLRDRGIRRAAVSDGGRGLDLFDIADEEPAIQHVPGFPVQVVDTTGAGDVLHAALIAEWLLGEQPAVAAGRFAAAAAALSCQGWGTRMALPTRGDVQAKVMGEREVGGWSR